MAISYTINSEQDFFHHITGLESDHMAVVLEGLVILRPHAEAVAWLTYVLAEAGKRASDTPRHDWQAGAFWQNVIDEATEWLGKLEKI